MLLPADDWSKQNSNKQNIRFRKAKILGIIPTTAQNLDIL
jgi:hypothetical protein